MHKSTFVLLRRCCPLETLPAQAIYKQTRRTKKEKEKKKTKIRGEVVWPQIQSFRGLSIQPGQTLCVAHWGQGVIMCLEHSDPHISYPRATSHKKDFFCGHFLGWEVWFQLTASHSISTASPAARTPLIWLIFSFQYAFVMYVLNHMLYHSCIMSVISVSCRSCYIFIYISGYCKGALNGLKLVVYFKWCKTKWHCSCWCNQNGLYVFLGRACIIHRYFWFMVLCDIILPIKYLYTTKHFRKKTTMYRIPMHR